MTALQLAKVLICALFVTSAHAQRMRKHGTEENALRNPTTLPGDAIQNIANDSENRFDDGAVPTCIANEKQEAAAAQLLCDQIDLGDGRVLFVAIGVGKYRGAHIVPFWIFLQEKGTTRRVFKTSSDAMTVRPTSLRTMPTIDVTWVFGAGATVHTEKFRWSGQRYTRFYQHDDHNE